MRKSCIKSLLLLLATLPLLASMNQASAAPIVYGFDTFADSASITNQIAGMTFTNTIVLKAGVSLNDAEFPPRSLDGVVSDNGGAITISFATPVFSVGGYFNYVAGLTFSAYDNSNNLLGTDLADFASNLALSGNLGSSPNELLSLSNAFGQIARVVITGDGLGGSFTMDDLTVDAGSTVPEPATLALLGLGLIGLGLGRRARSSQA